MAEQMPDSEPAAHDKYQRQLADAEYRELLIARLGADILRHGIEPDLFTDAMDIVIKDRPEREQMLNYLDVYFQSGDADDEKRKQMAYGIGLLILNAVATRADFEAEYFVDEEIAKKGGGDV